MKSLALYIVLARPVTLIAPAVGILSGALMPAGRILSIKIIPALLAAVLLNAASNSLNQICDLDIDKINKPDRPLPSGKLSVKSATVFTVLIYLFSLFAAYCVNWVFFTLILIAALITVAYSLPLVQLKKRAFLSNISIALARGLLLIVAGWSVNSAPNILTPWCVGTIFALYVLGAASTKDFSDIEGDSKYGMRTLPIVYGTEKAVRIIGPFFYIPFLLVPVGVFLGQIPKSTLPLTLLSLWGYYTFKLLSSRPEELTLEANHVSWKHMYLILIAGQLGFALSALVSGGFL